MNQKITKIALILSMISFGSPLYAAAPQLKGKTDHTYTIRITSTTGKQVPLNGTMMQWPTNAPVGFYDFHASKVYTPYEGQISTSEVMLNLASFSAPLKVELIDNDDSKNDVSLSATGNYFMLYSNGGKGSFITARN